MADPVPFDFSNWTEAQIRAAQQALASGVRPPQAESSVGAQARTAAQANADLSFPGMDVSKIPIAEIRARLGLTAPPDETRAPGESATDVAKGYAQQFVLGLPIAGGAAEVQNVFPGQEEFAKAHPGATAASRLLGTALSEGGAAAKFPSIARGLGFIGETTPRQAITAGASGAGLSGLDEYIRSGGDISKAGGAAAVGGGLGVAGPVAGKFASALLGKTADVVHGFQAPPEIAALPTMAQDWVKQLGRNMNPTTVAERQAALGPQGFLFEMDPNLTFAGENIRHSSGPGAGPFEAGVKARGNEALSRTEGYLTNTFGPKVNIPQWIDNLEKQRAAGAATPYDLWRSTSVPLAQIPGLPTIDNPLIQRVLPQATEYAKITKTPLIDPQGNPTAGAWDLIKRALYDEQTASSRPYERKLLGDTRHQITDAIDGYFSKHSDPNLQNVWRNARTAWAEPSQMKDAFNAGRQIFHGGIDPDEFAMEWARYSQPQRDAFMQAARADVSNAIGDSTTGGSAQRNRFLTENSKKILNTMFANDPQKATDLLTNINAERAFKRDEGSVLGGSPTYQRENINKMMGTEPQTPGGLLKTFAEGIDVTKPASIIGLTDPMMAKENMLRSEQSRAALVPLLLTQGQRQKDIANMLMNYGQPRLGEKVDPATRAIASYLMSGVATPYARAELQR